jgi:hypothetical protein
MPNPGPPEEWPTAAVFGSKQQQTIALRWATRSSKVAAPRFPDAARASVVASAELTLAWELDSSDELTNRLSAGRKKSAWFASGAGTLKTVAGTLHPHQRHSSEERQGQATLETNIPMRFKARQGNC